MIPAVHLSEAPEPPAYWPDERIVLLECTRIDRRGRVCTTYPAIIAEATPGLTPEEIGPSASYRMF